jgi:FkbM family methyltransferase
MNVSRSIARINLLDIWQREMKVWGFRLTPPTLDRRVCLTLHQMGLMGRVEEQFFRKSILPGMTVVDIGANQGLYTLLFSRLVGPSGRVLAFEPEPDMFVALSQNRLVNGAQNVDCFQLAVGAQSGAARLARSLFHAGDNRISTVNARKITQTVDIRIVTLDEMVGDRTVDFVKMDVQGWEGEAFRGMESILEHNRHLQIHFEFWPYGLRNAGCDPFHLLASLRNKGFQLFEHVNGSPKALPDNTLGESWKGRRFTNLYARR